MREKHPGRTSVGSCALLVFACSATPAPRSQEISSPPVAARRPHEVKSPFGVRNDPYYWLRDDSRTNRDVLAYLDAENRYARAALEPARRIEEELVREARARVDEDETSVATFEDGYWYYSRYERGKQYAIYARKGLDGREQVLLDGNALAAKRTFYEIGDYAVSRDGKLLAWTEDVEGREIHTLRVKDLSTGKLLADTATHLAPTIVWANDNATLFLVGRDPKGTREDRVLRHRVGGKTELVYEEKDASYYVDLDVTKSRRHILIELDATTVSETRLIDANKPEAPPRVFWPREDDHIYEVDQFEGLFVVRTNKNADNFKLVSERGPDNIKGTPAFVEHDAATVIEGFGLYHSCWAATVRTNGLRRVRVYPLNGTTYDIEADQPTFSMSLIDIPAPDARTNIVRYSVESLTTPEQIFELDCATGAKKLVWQERVPTYDASNYTSQYIHAWADDNKRIPISIVRRNDTPLDGTAPLLVTGYGAYGETMEPTFDRERASLLDRGWVIALAHVRGGGELGQPWYDAGRLLQKKNSFTDFIAVTEFLVAQKYGAHDRVFAEGASAGGLLLAAVANMRPSLYRGMVVWVPFVDVVTTMLDETLPLVTNEYEEWGDPREKAAHDYMLSYSPYDNVRAQAYPALYVRTGLHDTLVQYHEPAKWVAKLRATKTDKRVLVFETDMSAGHRGVSGRYDAIREEARAYAFVLWQAAAR